MAYNAATITAKDVFPDGLVHLQARFTGNAGEPAVLREQNFDASADLVAVRRWAIDQVRELNGRRTLSALAQLATGQVLDLTAIAPTGLTPKEQWFRDLSRLLRVQDAIAAGVLPATFDDAIVTTLSGQVSSIPIVAGDF